MVLQPLANLFSPLKDICSVVPNITPLHSIYRTLLSGFKRLTDKSGITSYWLYSILALYIAHPWEVSYDALVNGIVVLSIPLVLCYHQPSLNTITEAKMLAKPDWLNY